MWPFKRKVQRPEEQSGKPVCTHCGSNHTRVIASPGSEYPYTVSTWRGQRYVTCRCSTCGRNFYIEENRAAGAGLLQWDDDRIDEEALEAAEDEIKKQIEADDDRTFR